MNQPLVSAEAPSNIALIKYMGKVKGAERNKPTNSSLSLTLPSLRTRVEIYPSTETYDSWATLEKEGFIPTKLSERGRKRYLAHFGFLKQKLGISGCYLICSANNFPSDCGIASSASSFAALTLAAYQLAVLQNPDLDISLVKLAELSRIGSGSSIRSFTGPFVLWNQDGLSKVTIETGGDLIHQVYLVEKEKKAIGSSDAHERVSSSSLFVGRPERAEKRLVDLIASLRANDWKTAQDICWAEFWDMHALFSTSAPPFQYMRPKSIEVLEIAQKCWQEHGCGPLVTMDAGANVHLIWKAEHSKLAETIQKQLSPIVDVLSSRIQMPTQQSRDLQP